MWRRCGHLVYLSCIVFVSSFVHICTCDAGLGNHCGTLVLTVSSFSNFLSRSEDRYEDTL
jgi:hypothetical protein